jgi:hypothetical protein
VAEKFPRLSKTLPCPRVAGSCQGCGRTKEQLGEVGADLILWIECDDFDQPTQPRVYVQLCTACDGVDEDGEALSASERQPGRSQRKGGLIDRHPRLYEKAIHNSATLGAMNICVGCKFSQELRCVCPLAKANGGPGMAIGMSEPSVMFLDGVDGAGRRRGWRSVTYARPPQSCAGRETEQPVQNVSENQADGGEA